MSTNGQLSQGDYFAQLPETILRDELLSVYAKVLYGVLLTYPEDNTFPGQERLAKQVGCCPKTISKYMQELVKCGLVEVTRRGQGKTNLYKVKRLELRQPHSKVEKEEVVKADSVKQSLPFKKSTSDSARTSQNTKELYSASNNKGNGYRTPYKVYNGYRNGYGNNNKATTDKPIDFSKYEGNGKYAHLFSN